MPRKRTVARMIDPSVTRAVSGAPRKPENEPSSCGKPQATGARFRPMSATIVPVTTGGMSRSIQRVPARCTTTPTTVSSRPVTRMPPTATDAPPVAVAARIGAMNANEDPR
jgi:hypothetical protein